MGCATDGFGAIVTPPENVLFVPAENERAHLRCESDTADEIAWTYDGNTIIHAPCEETRSDVATVFSAYPKTTPSFECNINASLEEAKMDRNIRTISGPYGCTDRTNQGVTETAMIIVLGEFRYSFCLFRFDRVHGCIHSKRNGSIPH